MVETRARRSWLGLLALMGGLAALALTRFNPTGVQAVAVGPVHVPLTIAVGAGSAFIALIALLAAATSPRTGTALPIIAVLVCAAALCIILKPTIRSSSQTRRSAPPAPASSAPSMPSSPRAAAPAPEPHVRTIFDPDYPSAAPAEAPSHSTSPTKESPASASPAESLAAARRKRDAARAAVLRQVESTAAYRAAKADADAADEALKQARATFDPGNSQLIAASEAAMEAHKKVQQVITAAAERDPAFQEAERELKSAQQQAPGISNRSR